jgi:hypothetical protein
MIGKISLSMRDCDQETGKDLMPQRQAGYTDGESSSSSSSSS